MYVEEPWLSVAPEHESFHMTVENRSIHERKQVAQFETMRKIQCIQHRLSPPCYLRSSTDRNNNIKVFRRPFLE